MKKNINRFLFVVFIAFAVLQLNDPDGLLWFIIYFVIAAICLYSSFRKIPKLLLVLVSISLLAFAAFHFSLFIDYMKTENKEEIFGEMVYEKPYLEGTREFIGLLLAAAAVIYQLKIKKKLH